MEELLKRQDKGTYYRPAAPPDFRKIGSEATFWNAAGEQAKDTDADAARQQKRELNLKHGFRAVRKAFWSRCH